jgi:hypothetical protein
VKTGSAGACSARSGSARSSSTSGTHSSGGSEKPGLGKRRGKKKECHSPLGNVRVMVSITVIAKSSYKNCVVLLN